MTYCPDCGEPDVSKRGEKTKYKKGEYDSEAYPDLEVIHIATPCVKCGFGWNCIGTRKVK